MKLHFYLGILLLAFIVGTAMADTDDKDPVGDQEPDFSHFGHDHGAHNRTKRAYCSAWGCTADMCRRCCYNNNGFPCVDYMRRRCC